MEQVVHLVEQMVENFVNLLHHKLLGYHTKLTVVQVDFLKLTVVQPDLIPPIAVVRPDLVLAAHFPGLHLKLLGNHTVVKLVFYYFSRKRLSSSTSRPDGKSRGRQPEVNIFL